VNNSILEIYSKGLYASWCYHKPSRTLFDCGEGFASYQGNFIYGVERIVISHGHGDHVLGIPSLIGCRNSARGDRKKPLVIYYPHGDRLVESVRDFTKARNDSYLRYDVEWKPIMPGFEIDIGNNQVIQSFEMKHQRRGITLGYRIREKRHKLRPEYVGKDIPELIKSGVPRNELKVWYTANTFVYALDAFYFDAELVRDADLVVMDCTFVNPEDRDDDTHFTLQEAYDVCRSVGVKKMIAAHFSPRYLYPDIKNAVSKLGNEIQVIPVFHNQVTEV
jgi:ribonuclease Z